MGTETKKPKKPYRAPVVRSEKVLVANLFASPGQGCDPFCDGMPPTPDA